MHASTSTALYQLVVYLTRPLTKVYPAQMVAQLQTFLHANLTSQFLTSALTLSPFTLILSPASLPPTPLYAACLQSGVAWPQWIHALGGQTSYIFVMEKNIQVRVGQIGEAITVWSGSDESTQVPAVSKIKTQNELQAGSGYESPMARKLQAMLDSVRSRNTSTATARSITLPALISTTRLSHTADTESDDISDSESDTESTTSSSLFSESSSTESMTSASPSSTSSPVSGPADLPAVAAEKAPVYVPRHRLTAPPAASAAASPSISTQHLSRSQRRLANTTVDKTKIDLCRYTYQGGQTCVMTGGVMLGAVKRQPQPQSSDPKSGTTKQKPSMSKKSSAMVPADSSRNWRARA